MFIKLLLISLLSIAVFAEDVTKIPVEKLFCRTETSLGSVSPDGKHYAVMAPVQGNVCDIEKSDFLGRSQDVLVLINLETGEGKRLSGTDQKSRLRNFFWLDNESLAVQRDDAAGIDSYSIYRLTLDGKTKKLVDVEQPKNKGGVIYPAIFSTLPQDKSRILITRNRFSSNTFSYRDLFSLDIKSKKRTLLASVPTLEDEEHAEWIVDNNGDPRGFISISNDGDNRYLESHLYYKKNGSNEYTKLRSFMGRGGLNLGPAFEVLGFDFDNETMIISGQALKADGSVENYTDTAALWTYDPENDEFIEMLYHDDFYDISSENGATLLKHHPTKTTIGVRYFADEEKIIYFNKSHPWSVLRSSMEAAFPGKNIYSSFSDDLESAIVLVRDETHPGKTYYFDKSKGSLQFVQDAFPWLNEYEFGRTQTFYFKTRDGFEMQGYLTLPPNYKKGTKIPFILHPHGGPWARDFKGYNPEVQLYATRGYGVIQVNFRVSTGFGIEKFVAAEKQFGLTMQDDLIDALFHIRDQGFVDMNKVCVSGASYGGYATMVALTKTPELFKCGINYVGLVDLEHFYKPNVWQFGDYGKPLWYKMAGHPKDDLELIRAASPANFVENIDDPLMVIHGRKDRNVDFSQALLLKDKLEEVGKDFIWIVKGDEAHGFYEETANVMLYKEIEKFLADNLN